jgi:hypothetical protein
VVYVEHGRGSAEAATVAHRIFGSWASTAASLESRAR